MKKIATEEAVWSVCKQLEDSNQAVSSRNVMKELGGGSSTVLEYIKSYQSNGRQSFLADISEDVLALFQRALVLNNQKKIETLVKERDEARMRESDAITVVKELEQRIADLENALDSREKQHDENQERMERQLTAAETMKSFLGEEVEILKTENNTLIRSGESDRIELQKALLKLEFSQLNCNRAERKVLELKALVKELTSSKVEAEKRIAVSDCQKQSMTHQIKHCVLRSKRHTDVRKNKETNAIEIIPPASEALDINDISSGIKTTRLADDNIDHVTAQAQHASPEAPLNSYHPEAMNEGIPLPEAKNDEIMEEDCIQSTTIRSAEKQEASTECTDEIVTGEINAVDGQLSHQLSENSNNSSLIETELEVINEETPPIKDLPPNVPTVAPEVSTTTNKPEPPATAQSPATPGTSEHTVTTTPAPAPAPKPAPVQPGTQAQETAQSQTAAVAGIPEQPAHLPQKPVSAPAKEQTAIPVENVAKTASPTKDLPLNVPTVAPEVSASTNKTEPASTTQSPATPGTSEPTVTTTLAPAPAPKPAPTQPGTQAQETAQSQAAAVAGIPTQLTPLPQQPVSAPAKEQTAIPVENVAKTASPTKDLPLNVATVAPEVPTTTNKTEPAPAAPSPVPPDTSAPRPPETMKTAPAPTTTPKPATVPPGTQAQETAVAVAKTASPALNPQCQTGTSTVAAVTSPPETNTEKVACGAN